MHSTQTEARIAALRLVADYMTDNMGDREWSEVYDTAVTSADRKYAQAFSKAVEGITRALEGR